MPFKITYRTLVPLLTIICLFSKAQSPADQKKQEEYEKLNSLVLSRQYRFDAQSATAMKGRTVQLSGGYGLRLNKDSLEVYLPYYGRAYSTDYPPSSENGGININTVNFSYVADSLKKGGWDITIKPKNSKVNSIFLYISTSGYCSVRINSSNRDPISYHGTLKEITSR